MSEHFTNMLFRIVGYFMNYTTVALFLAFMAGMAANAGSLIGCLVFLAAAVVTQISKGNILELRNELSSILRKIVLNW